LPFRPAQPLPLTRRLNDKSFTRMSAANAKPTVPTTPPHPWPSPSDWPAEKVRQTYIEFFVNQPEFGHTFWPSSGVIPFDDDTLLFANAVRSDSHVDDRLAYSTGYEPVQAVVPRNRRPQIRFVEACPCGEQSKVYTCRRKAQWYVRNDHLRRLRSECRC
jgi:hypothetical protein